MSVFELHPEELIDREARGVLGTEDAARLESHRARCVACRYERRLRAHFAHSETLRNAASSLLSPGAPGAPGTPLRDGCL